MIPEHATQTLFIARLTAAVCSLCALTCLQSSDASIARIPLLPPIADARLSISKATRAFDALPQRLARSGAAVRLRSALELGFFLALLAGAFDAFGHLGYVVAAIR